MSMLCLDTIPGGDCADRRAESVKQCYIALCMHCMKRDKNCIRCHINLSKVLGYSTNFFSCHVSVAYIQDSYFILVCMFRPTYLFRCHWTVTLGVVRSLLLSSALM